MNRAVSRRVAARYLVPKCNTTPDAGRDGPSPRPFVPRNIDLIRLQFGGMIGLERQACGRAHETALAGRTNVEEIA
jgi:hypothetical protein